MVVSFLAAVAGTVAHCRRCLFALLSHTFSAAVTAQTILFADRIIARFGHALLSLLMFAGVMLEDDINVHHRLV